MSGDSLMHDDDSRLFVSVFDVALPISPKDFGSQCCRVYSIEVPTAFPDVFAQPVCQLFLVGWEYCRRLMFYGTIHGFHLNYSVDQPGTVSIAATSDVIRCRFFFTGDSGDSWPPFDAGATGSMLLEKLGVCQFI